ncbi:dihydrodipicolinate synthase family protein [Niallia sp. NCCP-28]|uniref:dihydrodipicolinate synthase family protein n=1 Tax=Niallia sp. NCCP-28 TaxID=2934712 RepID=UPI002080C190|nr:dihydrodipicolinate synthase family protein [Niallia sp. NCCP-28]GKU82985.1 4-hydroxy-tetrahydrodipicolinate synthase [Niallia sp. NCCP-28]
MLKETMHIAVPTAFYEDESLNIQGTIEHIKSLYSQGIHSVLVCGSTGEQHSLTLKEKLKILDALAAEEELIDNMEIIFGVSSIRQKEAVELAKRIQPTKIAAILLGYPPYILPTQKEALIYAKKIIHFSEKPTILYNNPKRTGFDLSSESIIELSDLELVIGLKEAGSTKRVLSLKNEIQNKNFYFYAGGEMQLEEKIPLGFNRLSSIAGNVYPLKVKEWFMHIISKQIITEQEKLEITSILDEVYTGSPLANVKKAINEKEIPMGVCRSPLGNA